MQIAHYIAEQNYTNSVHSVPRILFALCGTVFVKYHSMLLRLSCITYNVFSINISELLMINTPLIFLHVFENDTEIDHRLRAYCVLANLYLRRIMWFISTLTMVIKELCNYMWEIGHQHTYVFIFMYLSSKFADDQPPLLMHVFAVFQAWHVMVNNALRLATLNSVGDFILFLGKLIVMSITGCVGLYIFKHDPELNLYAAPTLVVCIFAYFVAHCVISLYEVTNHLSLSPVSCGSI